jgi:hypothetical protein
MAQTRLSTDDLAQSASAQTRDADDDDMIDLDEPATATRSEEDIALLDDDEADAFLARWSDTQARFVDDPQGAVQQGDALVAELMQALAQRFSEHKRQLEEQWQRGSEPGTEDLRLALQQYRSFFQRLLST